MLTHRPFRSSLHTQGRALLALLAAGAVAGCRVTPAAPQQPPTVKVAVAVEAEGDRALRLSGTIEAESSTALSFSVPGTIQEVRAADGARVVRGRVLARLDPRTFQDAVGIAELKVEQAEDAARRLEPMHRNGTIPDIKWVEVDTGLRQARLALSMAKKSLEDTILRAPQDGVVARRLVEPGGTALPGSPAFVLVQSRTMLATAPLPEREVATVSVGQRARVAVAALGNTYEGTVREIGVIADPLTRTYPVKIAVENATGALRVGMVAEVTVSQEARARPVVVPPEAVRIDEAGKSCVYVLTAGGTLRRQAVEVSGFVGERTALSSGVSAGDRVVVSGTAMLANGVRVIVADTGSARN